MRGVILDLDTLDRGDLDLEPLTSCLASCGQYRTTSRNQTVERIRDTDVVISNKVLLDAEALEQAEHLRLICIAATGTNNVDLSAAQARGITVCNVRRYATPSVVQHVFSLILALTTRLFEYRDSLRAGAWQTSPHFTLLDHPIRELSGRTLGIIGYGELGRAVAKTAAAFGLKIIVAQRPGGEPQPGRIALDTLLETADIVSLHCPLTPETRGLIGEAELARMKSDALLINAARGGIVDEHALATALRAGHLGGAGIDVLAEEPPRADSPLLDPSIPHLIVTPHIAWASRESRQRLLDEVAENIRAFARGEARNSV